MFEIQSKSKLSNIIQTINVDFMFIYVYNLNIESLKALL